MAIPGLITVFGSSRPWPDQPEYRFAHDLGRILGASGYTVCNGGYGGVMNKGLIPRRPILVVGDFWDNVVQTLREELAWEGRESATRFVSIVRTQEECAQTLNTMFENTRGSSDEQPYHTQ